MTLKLKLKYEKKPTMASLYIVYSYSRQHILSAVSILHQHSPLCLYSYLHQLYTYMYSRPLFNKSLACTLPVSPLLGEPHLCKAPAELIDRSLQQLNSQQPYSQHDTDSDIDSVTVSLSHSVASKLSSLQCLQYQQ